MTAKNPGALRAATLLRVLSTDARTVSIRTCIEEMEAAGIDDLPRADRSDEQLLRRAIQDLAEWGVEVQQSVRPDGERTLELVDDDAPLADRPRLSLSPTESRIRLSAAAALRFLDPDHEVDEGTLIKIHIPRDTIEFTYGESGTRYWGVPYAYVQGDRPLVRVRTANGDQGFHLDAIRTIVLIGRGDEIPNAGVEVPVVDAEPAGNPTWRRQRGRPGDFRTLREAQRVAAAVHGAARSPSAEGAHAIVPYDLIARRTRLPTDKLDELALIVEQVDPTIGFGADGCSIEEPGPGELTIDGAQALVARLDLGAVLALGDGATDLMAEDRLDDLHAFADRLDEFLCNAEISTAVESLPCAGEIVEAIAAASDGHGYGLPVRLDRDPSRWADLRAENLVWRAQRWWITGSLDGAPLARGQLALADVLDTDT